MAEYTKTLSGGSASSQYRIRMVVTESDVNINNNTSKVNVTAYIDKLKGTGYFSNDGKPWNIKIDGSTVASGNKTYDFRNYKTLTLGSGSKTITHNGDGSKSVAVSAYFNSSPYLGSATVSATFNLTTIARASSISSITGGSELNQSVTVNISRKSNSFTHKVEYSYAGSSYVTASTNAGTSCSFTPSISLASYVPNSTSGTLTVRVTTYNGSTQIGSAVTATKTLSVPYSVVPTMGTPSVTRIDNGVPSGWGIYVQSFSKATVTMTGVAGAYGSTIKSYSITGGGLNSNNSSATTGVLNTSGTITFTCTVIDSRGRSVSKSTSISVAAYTPPSLSLSAERSDSSGTPNASAGTCAKITATFSFASVSGKNSITSKSCSCNGQTNTSFASGTPFVLNANLSIGSSYTVTATITDALGRSAGPITVSISSASRIMNIKANKKGMGIGKFAELEDTLDVAWRGLFRDTVNALSGYEIIDDMNGSQANTIRSTTDPLTFRCFDIYNSEGMPTIYGDLFEMVGRMHHWQAQLLIGADSQVYVRNKDYNVNSFSDWYRFPRINNSTGNTIDDIVMANNRAIIKAKATDGSLKNLIYIGNDNYIYIGGDSDLTTYFAYLVRFAYATNIIGNTRVSYGWIGFYDSHANAYNDSSRKAWIGFSGTNPNFNFYIENGGEFKFNKTPVDPDNKVFISSNSRSAGPRVSVIQHISGSTNYLEVHTPNRSTTAWGVAIWASDKRLKKNIEDTKVNGIEIIKQIHHVSFDWKENDNHESIGYVADEVEEIFPEAVYEVGENKNKQISNTTITPLISKALQELIGIVEEQKKEIDDLKTQVQELKELVMSKKGE